MNDASRPIETPTRLTARALIVGERIDTAGLERPDMISSRLAMPGPLSWAMTEKRAGMSRTRAISMVPPGV